MRKSASYVTTLDVISVSDMQSLETIKATIRAVNAFSKNKKRVVLRGRKPFVKLSRYAYNRGGNLIGGITNASKLDVYIYDR